MKHLKRFLLVIFSSIGVFHHAGASDLENWSFGFLESENVKISRDDVLNCRDVWSIIQRRKKPREKLSNPFDVLLLNSKDDEHISYALDKVVDGKWVRVIPSKVKKISAGFQTCPECEVEWITCSVPTSWKVLDTGITVRHSPELQKVDQCVDGNEHFCSIRVSSLGGFGFIFDADSLPVESRPYGYLSWRLSELAYSQQLSRERRIRSEFRIDQSQGVEVIPITSWILPTVNNPVREVHFGSKVLSQKLPGVIAGESRSQSFRDANRSEVFLPLNGEVSQSSLKPGTSKYYRELFEGGSKNGLKIPGFRLLDVSKESDDGDVPCANAYSVIDIKKCREKLNSALYSFLNESLKSERGIDVALVLGGKSVEDGSIYFKQTYTISSDGNVIQNSSELIDPKEYQKYLSLKQQN